MINFTELKRELLEAYRCSDHEAAVIIMDVYCYEEQADRSKLEQDDLKLQVFQYAERLRNGGLI